MHGALANIEKGIGNSDKDMPSKLEEQIEGSGVVLFAGHNVQSLNVHWLRSQVAVVMQNPQLLSGTILDNVASGLVGTELAKPIHLQEDSPEEQRRLQLVRERCQEALQKAQAWDFVNTLPNGMDEVITGGRMGLLSGGQVQRIAIARALVSRPCCLILDEATSAVSTDAELQVQRTLMEEQKQGMTLIVIAHRLSTIKAADKVIVMEGGCVVQEGTYNELMDPQCQNGTFRTMARAGLDNLPTPQIQRLDNGSNTTTLTTLPLHSTTERMHKEEWILPPLIQKPLHALQPTQGPFLIGTLCGLGVGLQWLALFVIAPLAIADFGTGNLPRVHQWAMGDAIMIIPSLIIGIASGYTLAISGKQVLRILKRDSLRSLVRQEISFFESDQGKAGGLTAALETHPENIGNIFGGVQGSVLFTMVQIIGGPVVASIWCWRIAVMALPMLALSLITGKMGFEMQKRFNEAVTNNDKLESDYIAELANSVQLIASLGLEGQSYAEFQAICRNQRRGHKYLIWGTIAMAVAEALNNAMAALLTFYAATLFTGSHHVVSRHIQCT
jgi:ATP-binding cassette, subfamily B (MDR/TAP), member 1